MSPADQFNTMRLLGRRIDTDKVGDLVRIETRKCDRTGLVLTRAIQIECSEQYLRASHAACAE